MIATSPRLGVVALLRESHLYRYGRLVIETTPFSEVK